MASHAKTMLEKIKSVLEGRITSDIEQYAIAGQQITKIPISELLVLYDKYKGEVAREEEAERLKMGLKNKRKIKVRL